MLHEERGGGVSLRLLDKFKLDRTAISVANMHDEPDERAFWHSKTPEERLEALEFLRQIAFGYDPDTERLQRFLEIIERKGN